MARPIGSQNKDKPYRDAIRMEAAAAESGEELELKPGTLRFIARQLLKRAGDETAAAKEVGDRLDGRAAQESTLTINDKRDGPDWTRDELVAFLNDAKAGSNGAAKANGSDHGPDSVH